MINGRSRIKIWEAILEYAGAYEQLVRVKVNQKNEEEAQEACDLFRKKITAILDGFVEVDLLDEGLVS